jgi:ABC-type lipoprotein release transport system permease subunit
MPPALGLVVRVVFGMVLAMVGLAVLALLFFWWVMSGFKN